MAKERVSQIDFLKGIAIFAIVMAHSPQAVTGIPSIVSAITSLGARGCQLFFILSGFTSYLSWGAISSPKSVKFYKNRLLAIIPGYYFMLITWQLLCRIFPSSYLAPATPYTIIVNFMLLHGILSTKTDAVAGGWYIGVQICLYIIFPCLIKLTIKLYRRLKKFFLWLPIIYIFLLFNSLVVNLLFTNFLDGALKNIINQSYTGFISHIVSYVLGIILAYQYQHNELPLITRYTKFFMVLSLIIALYSSYASWINIRLLVYTWSFFFYWVVVLAINIWERIQDLSITKLLQNWGKISYSIYLTHMLYSIYLVPLLVSCFSNLFQMHNTFFAYCLTICIYLPLAYYTGIAFNKVLSLTNKILRHNKLFTS